jgi:hypothetical protein
MPLRLGGVLESFEVQRRGVTGGDDPPIMKFEFSPQFSRTWHFCSGSSSDISEKVTRRPRSHLRGISNVSFGSGWEKIVGEGRTPLFWERQRNWQDVEFCAYAQNGIQFILNAF